MAMNKRVVRKNVRTTHSVREKPEVQRGSQGFLKTILPSVFNFYTQVSQKLLLTFWEQ